MLSSLESCTIGDFYTQQLKQQEFHNVGAKPEDAEYMGFKYIASFLVQALKEGDVPAKVLKHNKEQLEKLRVQTKGKDVARVDGFIKDYKPQLYWYKPEFENPGAILKTASTDLYPIYRIFSGAVHGGFVGSSLFDDTPDTADINPQNHPRRTRVAIVMSSRLILEISYLRDRFEGTRMDAEYKRIMQDLYLPQKEKLSPAPTAPPENK